jgi:hypothetical protein
MQETLIFFSTNYLVSERKAKKERICLLWNIIGLNFSYQYWQSVLWLRWTVTQETPPKRRYPCTLHGVIFQKKKICKMEQNSTTRITFCRPIWISGSLETIWKYCLLNYLFVRFKTTTNNKNIYIYALGIGLYIWVCVKEHLFFFDVRIIKYVKTRTKNYCEMWN